MSLIGSVWDSERFVVAVVILASDRVGGGWDPGVLYCVNDFMLRMYYTRIA